MIKVISYKIPCYTTQIQNRKSHPSFLSNNATYTVFPTRSYVKPNTSVIPWVKDENLTMALNQLNNLKFDKKDVKYIQSLGVVLPFLSGKEAIRFIKDSRIDVKFADLDSEHIHAQYDYDNNCIKINAIYKNTKDAAVIFAISEAILHEAGHAKDKDSESTLQEEIDCLSMNALSHRILSKKYPNVFLNANSLIVQDGVCVYADLFFDNDPLKTKLVARLKQKYGNLPAGDFDHPPSIIALNAKTP